MWRSFMIVTMILVYKFKSAYSCHSILLKKDNLAERIFSASNLKNFHLKRHRLHWFPVGRHLLSVRGAWCESSIKRRAPPTQQSSSILLHVCTYFLMYSEMCYAGTLNLLDNMCWEGKNEYQMLFLYFQFSLGHPLCSGVLQLSFQIM